MRSLVAIEDGGESLSPLFHTYYANNISQEWSRVEWIAISSFVQNEAKCAPFFGVSFMYKWRSFPLPLCPFPSLP